MTLHGYISNDRGITASIKAMHLEMAMLGIHNDNVLGFDKVGFQRKDAVVSSFAEYLGVHALSTAVDDSLGRLVTTKRPLDLALSEKGYFQVQGADGVKLTRDGRFKLDKDGYLLTQINEHVLSNSGVPIKFSTVPKDLSQIKIDDKGAIYMINPETLAKEHIADIGVVSEENAAVLNPGVRQGYTEYSNVQIGTEFMKMVPTRRNYEANRKMFALQNSVLNSIIERLGTG